MLLEDAPTVQVLHSMSRSELKKLGKHVNHLIHTRKVRFGGVEKSYNKNLYEMKRAKKRRSSVFGDFY